jgi:hypothetical protein
MTISSTTRKAGPFTGTGAVSTFAFTFKVFTQEDLAVVRVTDATGIETTLQLTTDYTVSLNPNQNSSPGGSITLTGGALATGDSMIITSAIEPLQETDLTNQGGFYPEVINDSLDRNAILLQQIKDDVDRSIKLSKTNTINNSEFSTGPTARANKFLSFDSQGDLIVTQSVGTPRGTWAAGESYVNRDIVVDPVNFNVYIASTAHTASGTAPIKDNPQISNWDLLVDAEYAGTKAQESAASAAAALASEQTAAADAATASQKAGEAVQSRTAALLSEQAALASEQAAAASEQAAAISEGNADQSAQDAAASASAAAAASGGGTVKVTTADTTADTLNNKFVQGVDVELKILNPGGAEQVRISAPYSVAYAIALGG